jgi:transposase
MKCKRDSDGRELDHHTLLVMRQQAVKAVKNGQTVANVAAAMGINIRTVFRWLSDFATGDQNALLSKKITGRPPLMTPDEMCWIAETVRDKTPWQMRVEFGLWTLSLIGEIIYRQFGKRLTAPSVGRIMRLLGFRPQKPLYQAWQQDSVLVENGSRRSFRL